MHIRTLAEGRWNLARPRRQQCPPWGLEGGMHGETGAKLIRQKGEAAFRDADVSRYLAPADTEVFLHAGSGGGWGSPLERDPEKVRWDVLEDLVSRESARDHYGVVLTDDELAVDVQGTAALRARLGATQKHD
jgi:N-methylhydantoinase B